MKTAAFTALHYGMDYLEYAIRSVAPFVDEWLFAYSPVGSHGYKTSVPCPETEAQLKASALRGLEGLPYQWWTADWPHEGYQRDSVYSHTDADLIIVVDADEVWQTGAVEAAIEHGEQMTVKHGRVPFVHFWRSFNYICKDGSWPIRLLRPALPVGDYYAGVDPVLHFGYAQPETIQVYKWFIHGHKGELRLGWHDRKYKYWTPQDGPHHDLHPTNTGFWNTESYDRGGLPELMYGHPFYDMEIIR